MAGKGLTGSEVLEFSANQMNVAVIVVMIVLPVVITKYMT
jgi:hypothetical protein